MAAPTIDYERAANILAEDQIHGAAVAAKRAGVSAKTVYRYRERLETDDDLRAAVNRKKEALLAQWEPEALRFMNQCLAKMALLVEEATVENLRDVNGAAKIIGELLVANGALGGGQSLAHYSGATTEAPPSGTRQARLPH